MGNSQQDHLVVQPQLKARTESGVVPADQPAADRISLSSAIILLGPVFCNDTSPLGMG